MQKAKKLYKKLVETETILRNHSKIMRCLPARKIKKYNALLASAIMHRKNAQMAFEAEANKLSPEEFDKLHRSMYV